MATLAREYQDGVVNICLGNLRPEETVIVTLDLLAGTEPHDHGFRFRFPFTLPLVITRKQWSAATTSGTFVWICPPSSAI